MERNMSKSPGGSAGMKGQPRDSTEEQKSVGRKTEIKTGVNSWDTSSLTPHEKSRKKRSNDWDSSSECQETMVEPFDDAKEFDHWDSESEQMDGTSKATGQPFLGGSHCSLDFRVEDLSDIEKSCVMEDFEVTDENKIKEEKMKGRDDALLVEDLEEFSRDQDCWKGQQSPVTSDRGSKVQSNHSEGTADDTTIWMIPLSERSQSADSTSKLISSSDREKVISIKKTKSSSDVRKCKSKRKPARFSRSDCLGLLEAQKNKNFLLKCEGQSLQAKLEINPKNPKEGISGCESFDGARVFFTEYECRLMTIDKDKPDKLSASSGSLFNREEVLSDSSSVPIEENPPESPETINDSSRGNSEEGMSGVGRAGPSGGATMDVVSLPDMIGRNSFKEREETSARRVSSPGKRKNEDAESKPESTAVENHIRESWVLLDDTGQYQPVTKNEVNILLNGRSADAVLQGRKEHFIPNPIFADTASPQGSPSGLLTKESLQHLLMEEDIGGENDGKKSIDLERKMENTLLYIQPGMNLTASVRIIPVDTEMIHIWRRTRDTGSVLSSEVDLRLYSSQDSVETTNQRHSNDHHPSSTRRMAVEMPVAEQDETAPPPLSAPTPADQQNQQSTDYSRLLMETRMMVDSLTDNFSALQSRLDGETSRSTVLQGEINKLRHILKNLGGKIIDRNSRETINELPSNQMNAESSVSILTVKPSDKTDIMSESIMEEPFEENLDNFSSAVQGELLAENEEDGDESYNDTGSITVNIYTVEEMPHSFGFVRTQDSSTVVQANAKTVEGKIQRLQHENEVIKRQNHELRKKLKEISQELEKYLWSTSDSEPCADESRELDALRDQVCNLKLELDYLKKSARSQEEALTAENSLMREECSKILLSLEEWCTTAAEVFEELQNAKSKLYECGILLDINLEVEGIQDPKTVSKHLTCYIQQTTQYLLTTKTKSENFHEQTQEQNSDKRRNTSREMAGLEQVISGYSALIDEYRKGQGSGDAQNRMLDDYFAVMVEKASLMEEIKILKTENEMLHDSQLEHYEKLKQTMIALKDRKSEVKALVSSQKLSEEAKGKMAGVLQVYEEEKRNLEIENCSREEIIQRLMAEMQKKDLEICEYNERLKAAVKEITNFDKSFRLKDELIEELKMENDRLLAAEEIKNDQIRMLKDDIQTLQMQMTPLESELTSTKVFLNESQKEMTAYITHLESIINDTQEKLEKTKQKLKESNETISRLRKENDVFDKQHQRDLKLYNKTKDDLELCKNQLLNLSKNLEENERGREELHKNLERLSTCENEKSEALEQLDREYKKMVNINANLKEKIEAFSKAKDESLKENKDLINKQATLSREIHKMQGKYRSLKAECNERTDFIRYLEMILKQNLVEYNDRIAGLEQNISRIIDKIMACKNYMRVKKHVGLDAEVKELRHQLDVTYQERKELEDVVNNYFSHMKSLKSEIREKEKKLNELHFRLSLEQRKTATHETVEKPFRDQLGDSNKRPEALKIDELESQVSRMGSELSNCRREMQQDQMNYEKEKKKLELIIADQKSEINRYQLRIEVMMKNFSVRNVNLNGLEKSSNAEEANLQNIKKELEEKARKIEELNETIKEHKVELRLKESDLVNSRKKSASLEEELRNVKYALSLKNESDEIQQKERNEIAEKLLQSIKLVMEERSARQTSEMLAAEKEKILKSEVEHIKEELVLKMKDYEALSVELHDKKASLARHEKDLKELKSEVASLKVKVSGYKKKFQKEQRDESGCEVCSPTSPSNLPQSPSAKRLESCLKELKEIREMNLHLRKIEGQYQAKIVTLENDLRDARLLIKELQGDVKTVKKSKKAFKNMIILTKMEIEKCLSGKELISSVAEKINRHLNLTEIPSRELLSGFRLNDTSVH